MFRKETTNRTDYYADQDGNLYRSKDFQQRGFSPVWLLPILLIPLALLAWGGGQLLRQNATSEAEQANAAKPANVRNIGAQAGVGGGPANPTSTQSAATPTPNNRFEAGVGGGPDDVSANTAIPSSPATGHGW